MNENQFIVHVSETCKANNVKFYLSEGERVNVDGIRSHGYFGDNPPTLAVGTRSKEFFDTLIHESCHLDQWLEKYPLWIKSTKYNDDTIINEYLIEKTPITDRIILALNRVQEIELDCERRAIKKINTLNLPINLTKYTLKSNAYIYLYSLLKRGYVNWPTIEPYLVKPILDVMPKKLLSNYTMSRKLKDLYLKHCYQ